MEEKFVGTNIGVNQHFELLEVKAGKYHVKFPYLDIPIEMNEKLYQKLLKDYNKAGIQN